jgi:NAD(P)-dependent dehydrogenase (short-subunit alcohol dehydrogenase family)
VAGSVGEDATWSAATAEATKRFGRIDAVVHVAGIGIFKPVHEHTLEEWSTVMDVNITAMFLAAWRHVVPGYS